jgi:hypothetical protein
MFTVIVSERNTGIVCHPDGQWWLATDGARLDQTFRPFPQPSSGAMNFVRAGQPWNA